MEHCQECASTKEVRDMLCFRCRVKTVTLHTERLAQMREAGTTYREMEKEIIDGAREDGRDIQRVGKSWT